VGRKKSSDPMGVTDVDGAFGPREEKKREVSWKVKRGGKNLKIQISLKPFGKQWFIH